MTSPTPRNPGGRSGGYANEVATFTDINSIFRFFQPRRMKISKNSPPVLNKDVYEGEIIFDKTLKRLYTVADQTLRYVQFT